MKDENAKQSNRLRPEVRSSHARKNTVGLLFSIIERFISNAPIRLPGNFKSCGGRFSFVVSNFPLLHFRTSSTGNDIHCRIFSQRSLIGPTLHEGCKPGTSWERQQTEDSLKRPSRDTFWQRRKPCILR